MMFIFTDIQGSTPLWEKYADEMAGVIEAHDAIILSELRACDGQFIKHLGDGIFARFDEGAPLQFAINVQLRISQLNFTHINPVRLRIALHAGKAIERKGDYFGAAVNRTARVLSLAKGGQVLLTENGLQHQTIPSGAFTRDLGRHQLRGISESLRIFELCHPHMETGSPSYRSVLSTAFLQWPINIKTWAAV